jgi:NAD(P)H-hydrate epimerase
MRQISPEEARRVDRRASGELGIPTLCLMENAGAGAARIAAEMLLAEGFQGDDAHPLCVAGPGQNGGDALVVARHLLVAGFSPRILVAKPAGSPADPLRWPGDAGIQGPICVRLGIPVLLWTADGREACRTALREAPLVVDGIFGTGLTRPVTGPVAELVGEIVNASRPVLALDVPSGFDADRGVPAGPCVRADVTATFLAPKRGFSAPGAAAWTGRVVVVPIGVPLSLADEAGSPEG